MIETRHLPLFSVYRPMAAKLIGKPLVIDVHCIPRYRDGASCILNSSMRISAYGPTGSVEMVIE
jgi:hypothetical protein